MPLNHSSSPEAFKQNVKTLMGEIGASPHVKSQKQALAIAYSIQRRGKKKGGKIAGFATGGSPEPGTLEYANAHAVNASGTPENMASGREGDYAPGFWIDPNTGARNTFDPNQMDFWQAYSPSTPASTDTTPPPTDTGTATASWHDVGLQQGDPTSPITWAHPIFGAPATDSTLPTSGTDSPPAVTDTPSAAIPSAPAGGNDLTGQTQPATPPTAPPPPRTMFHRPPPGGPPMMGQGLFGGHMNLPPALTNAMRPPAARNVAPGSPQMAFGGSLSAPGMNPYVHREMRPRLGQGFGRMTYSGKFMSPVPHVGAIKGPTMGRGDRVNMSVHPGSYVLPASHVAALGQGNSDAGYKILNGMFHSGPGGTGLNTGPGGMALGKPKRGIGMPRLPHADGGRTGEPVDIKAAHGEFVISPEEIQRVFGNLDAGHKALDAWVMKERRTHIKELEKLPPPVRD